MSPSDYTSKEIIVFFLFSTIVYDVYVSHQHTAVSLTNMNKYTIVIHVYVLYNANKRRLVLWDLESEGTSQFLSVGGMCGPILSSYTRC